MIHDNLFIKIPNEFIYVYEEGEITYMQQSKDNKYLIALFISLIDRVNRRGYCNFTIEMLLMDIGLKVNTREGKSFDKIKALLMLLEEYGYIYNLSTHISDAKVTTPIQCIVDESMGIGHFELYYDDYDLIRNSKLSVEEKISMLNLYCYILARYKGSYRVDKYKDGYTYFTLDDASLHLNMKRDTLIKVKNILIDTNMIKSDHIGKIKTTKRNCSDIYAFTDKGLNLGLQSSKQYYEDKYGADNIIYKIKKIDLANISS